MPRSPEAAKARALLLVLATIWGSTFVAIQTGVGLVSPLVLIALRFALAALVIGACRPALVREGLRLVPRTLVLSLSMLAGFALQTAGLLTTTPARSAFLTSLSVVFVPVLDVLDTKRLPRARLLLAAVLAAAGVLALFHPLGGEWRIGDTLTLLSAVVFAVYILALDRESRRHEAWTLVMAQALAIAALAGAGAGVGHWLGFPARLVPAPAALFVVAYLGIVCTAITFWMMAWAQARVSAVEAAVIYTLEPVVAALFSLALGRDAFSLQLPLGGALVVAAMLVASTDPSEPHPVAPPEGID